MIVFGIIIVLCGMIGLGATAANDFASGPAQCILIMFIGGVIGIAGGIRHDAEKNALKQQTRIVRTQLLSVDGIKQSTRSGTVSGALMGGIIAGGLGAVVGAMSNTREREHTIGHEYTFLIIYDDGSKEIETVRDADKYRLKQLVEKMIIDGEPTKEEIKPTIEEHEVVALSDETPRECPRCGTLNDPSLKYCNKCGHYLTRMPIKKTSIPQIAERKMLPLFGDEDDDEELVCPNCGKECAPTARKCLACGLRFDG